MNNEPVAYACQIVEADFETNILKIEMLDENYKVSAGIKYLCDTHPVKELRDKVKQCTNSDTWNCKYCKKTETCKALKDPRNFGTPKKPAKELTNQEILEISDEIYNKSVGDDIDFARAILKKAQE